MHNYRAVKLPLEWGGRDFLLPMRFAGKMHHWAAENTFCLI